MGSWNKTCALSNLAITDGEDCQLIVIREQADRNERCYSTAMWAPLMLAIPCKYADYGRADNLEATTFQLLIESLKPIIEQQDQGENKFHDIEVVPSKLNETLFFEAVHETRLSTKIRTLSGSKSALIDFVLIKQSILDRVFKDWSIELHVGEGQGSAGYNSSYEHLTLDQAIALIPDYLQQFSVAYDSAARQDAVYKIYSSRMITTSLVEHILKSASSYRYFEVVPYKDVLIDLLTSGKETEATQLVKSQLTAVFVDWFFERTRKIWVPACYEGSQNNELSEYEILAKSILNYIDDTRSKYQEEYGD